MSPRPYGPVGIDRLTLGGFMSYEEEDPRPYGPGGVDRLSLGGFGTTLLRGERWQ